MASLRSLPGRVTLWAALACVIVFCLGGIFLPRQPWLEVVRIAQWTTALMALVSIASEFWQAIRRRHPDRVDVFTIQAWLKEFAFFWTGAWLLLYRLSADQMGHKPEWMLDTLFLGFVSGWVPAFSSLLLITIPGVLRKSWRVSESADHIGIRGRELGCPMAVFLAVSLIAVLGLATSIAVVIMRPDVGPFIAVVHKWIP